MLYIGIDPGADGGFTFMCDKTIETYTLKDNLDKFIDMLDSAQVINNINNSVIIGLEHVHARPSDARKAAFSFGRNVGILEGIMKAYSLNYQLVEPQAWKKEFDLIGKDKQASIDKAKKLFPNVSLVRTERSKVDSDGMAESLLIAEYLRRFYEEKKIG